MRKYSVLFGFCILLFGFLALTSGCASPNKSTGEGKTVEMWVMPNSLAPVADLENLLKPFEEKSGIKVKITSVDWGAAWSKITTAATSGDVPDIVQLGSTWVSAIAGMGAMDVFSAEAIARVGGAKAFVPVAWSTTGIEKSGKVNAIPWIVDARALYFRTDALQKAKVSPAELAGNWDSFKAALKKLYDADIVIEDKPVAPFGMSGKNDWNVIHNLAPWIWMAGGDFLATDRKTCVLDSEEVFQAISFYISLAREGYVPPEYLELNTAQVSGNFNDGNCAMYFDGPYEIKTLTRPAAEGGASESITARNFAVTSYPKGPRGRSTFVGGSSLGIFKESKHKAAAFEVIKYLTSKAPQVEYAKVTGFLPAKLEAFDDPFFAKDPNRKIFKEAVLNGKTYPPIPSWGLLEPILTRRFGILWDYVTSGSDYDPEKIREQLKLAKKEVETILNQ